ncbi:MAG: c-type cytochrome [Hyphomicrobiales bacterium]
MHHTRHRVAAVVLTLGAIAVAVVAALWLWAGSVENASTERGRELAELLCAKCHAIGPDGESTNPKSPPFRTLEAKLTLEGIEDQVAEGLSLGHEPMPTWQFSSQQIEDLVTYIVSVSE